MSINTATLPTSLWSRVQQSIATLRDQQKVVFIVAAAMSIAVIAALALWARSPDYRTLYGSLSEVEGGDIVSALSKMNVPYQLDPHTGAILVPSQQVRELRLRLASQGLPKSSTTGFELLDDEKFGLSQFNEQVNFQRALAGELSRTIETLDPVVTARVHLAIPRPSVFVREKQPPTAAVTLKLQPGRVLDASQINAVVHLVASSVAGMSADNVTVVDQAGELLSGAGLAAQTQNTTQLKYTERVEKTVQQRIEQLLRPMLGQHNVRAQVTAEINFDRQEQTDERYQPNSDAAKQAIRSAQRSQSEVNSQQAEGVPGALSNQPTPPAQANIEADKKTVSQTDTASGIKKTPLQMNNESTVNYELDKTTRRTQLSTGGIKRLSVAVVVNYQQDKEGKEAALSAEQISQITSLVKQAMGYSEARGDSVNVVNTPFTTHEFADDALPWWQQSQWISLATQALRWLVVMIIALVLYRKIVSPAFRQFQKTLNPPVTEAPPQASEVDPSLNEVARKAQLRINAEQMSQRIRTMSENEPQVVALVIRDWMGSEL
ncbi:flagellar basal-body MS-ring/collar protein FliF [Rosenbergiella nectarea]|uniref:flagellar basal-body MS-ring/collar protein FliF n=1 Tax=Rosenbergiella nectarea TaxID=988801 RepID=UPI001BD94E72|nr:flagellar basal-body MS-ring/collar protein FliF [Rosenbergiella nectarea]MBT0729565.1 flagellar M-ring protein FliF [Rosenbergiella nectarea subsp. apis]